MSRFDRSRIRAFVALVGERLDGEWLLAGGAAAADWFEPARTTEDIDLVGLDGSQLERLAIMDLAAEASLPVEALNSTADYFVRRVDDWRDHLVVHHRGARATIYRPDATLFLLLKLRRLSEVDLADCVALIAHCEGTAQPLDRARVQASIDALPATEDTALRTRRAALRDGL